MVEVFTFKSLDYANYDNIIYWNKIREWLVDNQIEYEIRNEKFQGFSIWVSVSDAVLYKLTWG